MFKGYSLKSDKFAVVCGEPSKTIEDSVMKFMPKGALISLTFLFSLNLFAQGMYEQTEMLDRTINYIEEGVDLYEMDGQFSYEKLQGLETVVQGAQNMMKQLEGKDILNTGKGDFLKKRYQHLMNYYSVAKTFKECVGDEESQVSMKILTAMGTEFKDVQVSCRDVKSADNSNFDEFYSNVMAIAGKKRVEDVFQDVSNQSLENYAKTYANMKYSFDPSANPQGLADELCASKCDREELSNVRNIINKEFQNLKSQNAPRYSEAQIRADLDNKVDNINSTIDELNGEVNTRKRSLWWDAMDEGENFGPKYQNYLANFMSNVNDGPGVLLLTEEMKEAIGSPRLKDDYDKGADDQYEFPKHKKASATQVKKAKEEVFKNLKEQFSQTMGDKKSAEGKSTNKVQENLEDLLISNPIAAAQMLNKNPEYAHLMCDPLKDIGKNKKFDEKLDKVMLIGGAVLGVGLMATGVGSLVGGWLLAGTATATTLATTGVVAGVAGFTLGAVEGGYWAKRMIDHKHDINVFESSILAGASDEKSYQEAADALQKYKEARFDAILSLGFTGFESLTIVNDVGRMSRIFKNADAVGELSSAEKASAMKKVTDTYEEVAKNPQLLSVMNKFKKIMGSEKFAKFFASIASMTDKAKLSMLNLMAKIKPSSLDGDVGASLADVLNKMIAKGDLSPEDAKKLTSSYSSNNVANLVFSPDTNKVAARLNVTSPESIKTVDNVEVSPAQRVDIETDEDFSFYLKQLDDDDKEFTMKFIQLNRSREVPKEDIVQRLKNSVGQCSL